MQVREILGVCLGVFCIVIVRYGLDQFNIKMKTKLIKWLEFIFLPIAIPFVGATALRACFGFYPYWHVTNEELLLVAISVFYTTLGSLDDIGGDTAKAYKLGARVALTFSCVFYGVFKMNTVPNRKLAFAFSLIALLSSLVLSFVVQMQLDKIRRDQ